MVRGLLSLLILTFLFVFTQASAKRISSELCEQDGFTCYTVKKGETWSKLFPDDAQKHIAMRVNRMNIKLQPGMKIAIPNEFKDYIDHSPFPKNIDPPGQNVILVSLKELAFAAYTPDGTQQHWGPVAGGKAYCADVGRGCKTVTGKFTVYRKGGASCISSKFPVGKGGAPMPYCMFFHGGYALHGSPQVPGYHASHGCVRLFVDDAKWLNQVFTASGKTRVIVR